MDRYVLNTFVPPGNFYHVARGELRPNNQIVEHTHDFSEVFWIERGSCQHVINGQRLPLQRGDLVLIRPDDFHSFRDLAPGTGGREICVLVNIAFATERLGFLEERYFPDPATWPWRGGRFPAQFAVEDATMPHLQEWADGMSETQQTQLELDTFLLWLLHTLTKKWRTTLGGEPFSGASAPHVPSWLEQALDKCSEPPHLAGGPAELARLANRCPEHLNRVLRQHTGQTATAAINELRLRYAARQLRLTNRPILDIADDCGLSSLSHFHALFRERYKLSPRKYRVWQQSIL